MSATLMIMILPFVLFLSIQFKIDILKPLEPLSGALHQQCVSWFSVNSETISNSYNLSRAFICGQKITQSTQKHTLQKSGLYHAIVVSGGHFLFLDSVLKRLLWPAWLRFFLLGTYYLMTGLQAPGLRCLMQMSASSLCRRNGKHLSSAALCFYSGLFCLIICSPLWTSLSFWLSFTVSLSLSLSGDLFPRSQAGLNGLLPLSLIYLFLFPFNFLHGYLHPLNLILGMLLLQPFCVILLGSAGLIILGRGLNNDGLYELNFQINRHLFLILEKFTLIIPEKNHGHLSLFYLWFYLFTLLAIVHVFIIYFRRDTIRE